MIAVGDAAPPWERAVTLTDMVAYAGATWDWHRLHYDPAYLAARGLSAPVVDGQVFGAFLVAALQGWLGAGAQVRRLTMRYAAPMFAGERLRCAAEATAVTATAEGLLIECSCRVDVLGETPRAAVAPAAATVLLRA